MYIYIALRSLLQYHSCISNFFRPLVEIIIATTITSATYITTVTATITINAGITPPPPPPPTASTIAAATTFVTR